MVVRHTLFMWCRNPSTSPILRMLHVSSTYCFHNLVRASCSKKIVCIGWQPLQRRSHMHHCFISWVHVTGKKKKLRHSLENATRDLHTKFGWTQTVFFCRNAVSCTTLLHVVLLIHEYRYWLEFCGHVVCNHGLWSCGLPLDVHSCTL